MKKGDKNKKGFSLIEAILVIGVAGLIFLMMMIALPALQRQERDTERREDITWLLDVIKKFQTNNRGALPGLAEDADEVQVIWSATGLDSAPTNSWAGFYRDHLKEEFKDPNGENYRLDVWRCNGNITNGSCSGGAKTAAEGVKNRTFPNDFVIYVFTQAKCPNDAAKGIIASSNARKLAVLYKLEGGGVYCADL